MEARLPRILVLVPTHQRRPAARGFFFGQDAKSSVTRSHRVRCQLRGPDGEAAIKGLHPYELPEIVAVSVVQGSPEYLDWINGSTVTEIG